MTLAQASPPYEQPRRRSFLTVKDVQSLTGLCASTIYDRARQGRLPGRIKVGTRILFDEEKLQAWLDAGGDLAEEAS